MDHFNYSSLISVNWLFILVITLIFTIAVLLIYYRLDEYDPEPPSQVFMAFLYGIITPVLTVPLHYAFIEITDGVYDPVSQYFIEVVIFAPIVEEAFKAYLLLRIIEKYNIDGPMDGIVYGIALGAGFATIENIIYGITAFIEIGVSSALRLTLVRGGFAFVGHPIYSAIFGYGIGATKVGIKSSPIPDLGYAILYHMLWNAMITFNLTQSYNPLFRSIYLIVVIILTLNHLYSRLRIARKIEKQLDEQGYYDEKNRGGYRVNMR